MESFSHAFMHEAQRIEKGVQRWRKATDSRLSVAMAFLLKYMHCCYTQIKKKKKMANYQDLIILASSMVEYAEVSSYMAYHIHLQ